MHIEKIIKKYNLDISEEGKIYLQKIYDTQYIFISKILETESVEEICKVLDLI